jgi:CheY-specific phosphatase CheX
MVMKKYEEINLIQKSIIEVFESVAFLFPMLVEDVEEYFGDMEIGLKKTIGISFEGEITGKMFLQTPDALSSVIAANMLGMEEDDPDAEEKGNDALKELLNIICGNVLPKIYGSTLVFKLSTPADIEDLDSELQADNIKETIKVYFDIEDNPVLFWFLSDNESE